MNQEDLLVLVCDDDPVVHESLKLYLHKDGMRMKSAFNGEDGLRLVNELEPSLVIIDIMMPIMSGLELCREIRKFSNVPIVMLTARGEEIDRILGLELGADDYIVKPFSPREVIARIKAIFRRIADQADKNKQAEVPASLPAINIEGLEINMDSYQVKIFGELIPFTRKEIDLLYLLASNINTAFSREQILEKIWGFEHLGQSRTIDTHIKQIRKKIAVPGAKWHLVTVHGLGYRFELL